MRQVRVLLKSGRGNGEGGWRDRDAVQQLSMWTCVNKGMGVKEARKHGGVYLEGARDVAMRWPGLVWDLRGLLFPSVPGLSFCWRSGLVVVVVAGRRASQAVEMYGWMFKEIDFLVGGYGLAGWYRRETTEMYHPQQQLGRYFGTFSCNRHARPAQLASIRVA